MKQIYSLKTQFKMKSVLKKLIIIFILTVFPFASVLPDQANKNILIYTFDINDMIAAPTWRITQKAFEEAQSLNADLIIIRLNTYGGTLDAADSIRTKILNSKIPVWVFIDNNAASAGALIAIACDSIYMRPGANIGAATVVDAQGNVVPDKYQSFMRSMMRSTAETKGRDPKIAEAMVDPSIYVENVSDSGKVLTFTANEAIKNNYCEGTAENIKEIIAKNNIQNYKIEKQELTAIDHLISFLISPVISGILIMLIIGGIYFELQSPGIGFALLIALLAALLYFTPLFIEGLAEHWEILLFIVGIVLVVVELFAIPGFGVFGISGIALIVIGLMLSMIGNDGLDFTNIHLSTIGKAFFIVIISFFVAIIASFFISKTLFTTHIFGELALETTQQKADGFSAANAIYAQMIGKQGTAFTMLRPSGKIEIEDEIYDATAMVGYIDKGEKVEVIKYENTQLFVRKV